LGVDENVENGNGRNRSSEQGKRDLGEVKNRQSLFEDIQA
jgi:hypothetical protein